MERIGRKKCRVLGTYCLILAAVHISIGLLTILTAFGLKTPLIAEDPIGGITATIIGAVYLSGVKSLLAGKQEGLSHLYVGAALSLVFGALYLLILAANLAEAALGNLPGHNLTDDLRAEIVSALLSAPALAIVLNRKKIIKR